MPAGDLVGHLELLEGKRINPAANAVAWVVGVKGTLSPKDRPSMASIARRFEPHALAVTRGTSVAFPNRDRIFHNAFSLTPGNAFDLGLYRSGASRSYTFAAPGLVRVFCNIHAQMTGYVMVLEETAFAVADARGFVRIRGVPPGRHRVRVWHEKAGESELTLAVSEGRETVFGARLDGTRHRFTPHKNKHGQDYPRGTRY